MFIVTSCSRAFFEGGFCVEYTFRRLLRLLGLRYMVPRFPADSDGYGTTSPSGVITDWYSTSTLKQ